MSRAPTLPRLLLVLFLLPLLARPGWAAEGAWVEQPMAKARLVAALDAVGQEATLAFGLELQLADKWKTYWRSPGDAGIPTSLDWSGSSNVADLAFLWPAPIRFTLFGLETYGYEQEVVFPLVVTPARPGEPVTLDARVTYMVCEEVCVPFDEHLTLTLPAGAATPGPQGYRIESFRARVPGDGERAGLALGAATLSGTVDAPLLTLQVSSRIPFQAPDVIVEGPPGYGFRAPAATLSADGLGATLVVPVSLGPQVSRPLEGAALTVTLLDGRRALEERLTPGGTLAAATAGASLPVALEPADWPTLLRMLGLALLGGLILNLMPCVLPVLSLKLLAVVGQGGRERRAIRVAFLASSAGILVTFLALAGIVVGLRAGGLAVGWGLQFQAAPFLAVMAVIVTLFAGNLLGLFEVPLPGAVARLGEAPRHESLAGHFATGLLATLLATPCSAPFLGTAVGFALAHGPGEILAIFAALGLGLALPYLAVAALPDLARRLPRPGAWMRRLRQVLALLLLATAGWLVSVLWQAAGSEAAAAVTGALLLLLLLLALRRRAAWRGFATAAAVVAALAGVAVPLALPSRGIAAAPQEGWEAFDDAAIPGLVAQGKRVFVDVTAEWCVTCLANKRLVLDQTSVQTLLAADDVVAMRADWTRPDPAINAYLERFGRFGIPFNVVYGPAAPQGLPLPELLTESAVREALAKAARP
jgi:suppressor for copper-sensitivity B